MCRNSGGGREAPIFATRSLDGSDGDVDKGDIRLLRGESLDHRRANARSAAGDEDNLVDERGVAGEGHGTGPVVVREGEGAKLKRQSPRRNLGPRPALKRVAQGRRFSVGWPDAS